MYENVTPRDIVSDETLVKEFRTGDRQAFDVLYERYADRVAGFVRGQMPAMSKTKREDLVQEVFLHALEMIGTFAEADYECFRHWLFAVPVARVMFSERKLFYRQQQAYEQSVQALKRELRSDGPLPTQPGGELSSRLRAALDSLPAHYRQATELHYLDGLPVETTAIVMGRTPAAVKHLLSKARTALRDFCGVSTPRRPERDSRAEVLTAARGLFAAHGFDTVSFTQIAEAANVSLPVVKYVARQHFGSKAALYAAATATAGKATA